MTEQLYTPDPGEDDNDEALKEQVRKSIPAAEDAGVDQTLEDVAEAIDRLRHDPPTHNSKP